MLHFLRFFFFFLLIGVNGGFLHMPSPASTIPAFPEQSAISACPLNLPDAFFPSVAGACFASGYQMRPRSRCCPTLAAWLYSAYSPAAPRSEYDDMPLLPDDTETCVAELGKAMAAKKVELPRPNSTCDLAYCYCGIRLHPFTCPAAGETEALQNLELHCKFDNNGADCSKCLRALYQLKDGYPANRTGDCELMGLTWLLAKDRAAYMAAVTHVLRTFMAAGGEPRRCIAEEEEMPMAVDSAELGKEEPGSAAAAAAAEVVIGRPFGCCRMLLVVVVVVLLVVAVF